MKQGRRHRSVRQYYYCCLLLLIQILLFHPFLAKGKTPVLSDNESSGAELYLMGLRIGDELLATNLDVYISTEWAYIDFAALLSATETRISAEGHNLHGWVENVDTVFTLDYTEKRVSVGQSQYKLLVSDLQILNDRAYVSTAALTRWFGFTFSIDTKTQMVILGSPYKLPYQLRAMKQQRALLDSKQRSAEEPVRIYDRYHRLTWPGLDLNFRHERTSRSAQSSTSLDHTLSMDVLGSALFWSGSALNSGNHLSRTNRLTFSRRWIYSTETEEIKHVGFQLGDVYSSSNNLVANGSSGLGFELSIGEGFRAAPQHQVTLSGDGVSGWDAELYQNDTLIEHGVVDLDGRYVFRNIELVADLNEFEVHLFGPLGELQIKTHKVWGGGAELPVGESTLFLSGLDFTTSLLDGSVELGSSAYKNLFSANLIHGFSRRLQTGLSLFRLGVQADSDKPAGQSYISTDARFSFDNGVLVGTFTEQIDSGNAWSLRYFGQWKKLKTNFGYQVNSDFTSPAVSESAAHDKTTEIGLSATTEVGATTNWRLKYKNTDSPNRGKDQQITFSIGSLSGKTSVNHELRWKRNADHPNLLSGTLSGSARSGNHSWRGSLMYTAEKSVDSFEMRWRKATASSSHYQLQAQYLFSNDDWSITHSFNHRSSRYSWQLYNTLASHQWWSIGLGFKLAVGVSPSTNNLYLTDRSAANTGRLSLRAFEDENGDKIHNDAEQSLAIKKHRNSKFEVTEKGHLIWKTVPADNDIKLDTNEIQLSNSFMSPSIRQLALHTHAGSNQTIDIPFQKTLDVEGSVVDSRSKQPLANISIKLLTRDKRVIQAVRSDFDGYFGFVGIRKDNYTVEISSDVVVDRTMNFNLADSDQEFLKLAPIELKKVYAD